MVAAARASHCLCTVVDFRTATGSSRNSERAWWVPQVLAAPGSRQVAVEDMAAEGMAVERTGSL